MEIKSIKKENLTLYYYGNIDLLTQKVVAVIGKRDVSDNVLSVSYNIGKYLAQNNIVVLNGLAMGCDKAAAEGAISVGGKVVAVLPCGIDEIYPFSCKKLAQDIIDNGGLIISQFKRGTIINKQNFIARDKTQVILSNKIVSVFCDEKGGTMHTVRFAHSAKKEIGCVLSCDGNDFALERFKAKRIENKNDLFQFINGGGEYKQLSLFSI